MSCILQRRHYTLIDIVENQNVNVNEYMYINSSSQWSQRAEVAISYRPLGQI